MVVVVVMVMERRGGSSTSSALWLLQRERAGAQLSPVLVHRAAAAGNAQRLHLHSVTLIDQTAGMDGGEINSSGHLQINLEA